MDARMMMHGGLLHIVEKEATRTDKDHLRGKIQDQRKIEWQKIYHQLVKAGTPKPEIAAKKKEFDEETKKLMREVKNVKTITTFE